MKQYSFVCPLPECGVVITVHAQAEEQGAKMLVEEAVRHLASTHPQVHKTHDEVTVDITSHMTETVE